MGGAIGPKGKVSKSRKMMKRASSWRISTPTLVSCSKCGEFMVPHRACRSCGSYKKKAVIEV